MRPAVAEVAGAGPAGVVRDERVAVVPLPLRPAQAAAGAAFRGTPLPRQLLLDRQGAARSWLPAIVHHRAGDGRVRSVLRRSLPPNEGGGAAACARVGSAAARRTTASRTVII